MIQYIGLMIGYYILTRMVELLDTGRTNAVKGFAGVGVLVTIVLMILIIVSGTEMMKYIK